MAEDASFTPPSPQRRGRALGWLAGVAAVYLVALWYLDRDKNVLSRLGELGGPLLLCAGAVLASYGFRYQRWHMLLRAQGHPLASWWSGLWAYVAGFAFTASPGKAGELLRIRYFSRLGVPPRTTLTTFVYERALDLLVITLMATGAARLVPLFGVLTGLVLAVVAGICLLACWPALQQLARVVIARLPGQRLRQLCGFLLDGVCALRPLLRPGLTLASALHGAAAWLLTSAAFAWLCHSLGIDLAWQHAVAIYPLAMLVGALSFVPGGVGTTEAAIVVMLASVGAGVDVALTAAIGIRLASLWLAVLVGMLAMVVLEARPSH
ncbi:lysylphosphatidylglycerol synthase transmembrane domain-containing protein [Stenotrophomonas sp.]|uniref:lysylphosphatidylglycerol synthase transmembrane domain-containing protein n=1 Tax=Stenotrophomonas sp. TaxID=69392 RepID=UPI0028A0D71D|nr:lysylphosphatidylglycerol synthase transmembrane domain-containing protein [Stenotrophomonas sp.]